MDTYIYTYIHTGATTHNLHLSGVFVGNKQVLVRAQLQLDPQAGMVLKVGRRDIEQDMMMNDKRTRLVV